MELEVRLRDTFDKPKEHSSEELADFMVMEQLIESMPQEAQLQVRERKPKMVKETGEMADDYHLARKAMTGEDKRRCYKNDQKGHLASQCKVVRDSIGRNTIGNSRSVQNARRENNTVTAP